MSFIVPDRHVVAYLQREMGRLMGWQWASFFDIRWDEESNALRVYERDRDGNWSRRGAALVDADGNHRQCHRGDADEVIRNRYGFSETVDKWRVAFEKRKYEREQKRREDRRDLCEHMAKTLIRVASEGIRPFVIPDPVRPERIETDGEVTVVDRRRDFQEAV